MFWHVSLTSLTFMHRKIYHGHENIHDLHQQNLLNISGTLLNNNCGLFVKRFGGIETKCQVTEWLCCCPYLRLTERGQGQPSWTTQRCLSDKSCVDADRLLTTQSSLSLQLASVRYTPLRSSTSSLTRSDYTRKSDSTASVQGEQTATDFSISRQRADTNFPHR